MNTDSTRKLYEKKLEEAMENAPVKLSSDKTYYREEGTVAPWSAEAVLQLYISIWNFSVVI